ncbi:MAG: FadR/GntR family transcriptional regulator [Paracoccaceae bacterium]
MPFEKIAAEKLAQAVVRQIELLILRGILRPGERLPAERDLAARLGVSRPSLREAVADLQNRGLVASRAGAGLFVADVLGSAFSDGLVKLFARHQEAVFDYIDFRRDMEGLAAERAARLATDTDLQVINSIFAKMAAGQTRLGAADQAGLDADFHMAIVEASHNVVMLHMMRSMFELLREGVFYNRRAVFRQKKQRKILLDQHRAINDAIQRRDPPAARAAIEIHMDFVKAALAAEAKSAEHDAIARQRLERQKRR